MNEYSIVNTHELETQGVLWKEPYIEANPA